MLEWFLLLLLVPAIVVPVVLLLGFAGCNLVFQAEADPPVLPKPENLVATPISVSEISLNWIDTGAGLQFEVYRAKDGSPFELLGTVPTPPFIDPPSFGNPPPLEPGVTYNYQVFTVDGDNKSEGSEVVRARPLAFGFDLSVLNGVNQGAAGDCIVQKIGSALLKNWGTVVRIQVRGATDGDLFINSIYISRVSPLGAPANPNPDPYDADTDITLIAAGVLVPANNSVSLELPSIYIISDPPVDLLIAFDIGAPQGRVRRAQLSEATAFTRNATQQAALPDRFPNPTDPTLTFNIEQNRLYLVERIEVL